MLKALLAENPAIPIGHIAASAPPTSITSALLFFIICAPSPIECEPEAQAVTAAKLGPFKLFLIEI